MKVGTAVAEAQSPSADLAHGSQLDQPVTRQDILDLFRIVLRREYGDDFTYLDAVLERKVSCREFITSMLMSEEFQLLKEREVLERLEKEARPKALDGPDYRIPTDLAVTKQARNRVLLVGQCLLASWQHHVAGSANEVQLETLTFNNASALPELGADRAKDYAYQICQIPLRAVLPDGQFNCMRYDDADGYRRLFEETKQRLEANFDAILSYNTKYNMLTFLLNFMIPQQNPTGRLQDRYYLGNLVYFLEELNRHFYSLIRGKINCFMIDLDQIQATFGKKYFSDDLLSHLNHGSTIGGLALGEDRHRLEPIGDVEALYTPRTGKVVQAVIAEAEANAKTIKQMDAVKLVIFDLDDTLWRGVAAELDDIEVWTMVEGWPLSIVEAALYLHQRGILIAIVSKNDEKTALAIWEKLYGHQFPMNNFVTTRINWKPKPENVREILEAVNLLPSSVLFVDDNPVERSSVKATFPDIRVVDAPLAQWRRILLWAPELQRSAITTESTQRTGTVQAQIEREGARKALDREAFLATLSVVLKPVTVTRSDDPRFARCFELLNKTN